MSRATLAALRLLPLLLARKNLLLLLLLLLFLLTLSSWLNPSSLPFPCVAQSLLLTLLFVAQSLLALWSRTAPVFPPLRARSLQWCAR